MNNLLPEKNKKELKREYALRVAVLCFVFLFITAIVAALFLLPSYVLSSAKVNDAAMKEERSKGLIQPANASTTAALRNSQSEINLIDGMQTMPMEAIIQQLISYKTPGITLVGFSIGSLTTQSASSSRQIGITGIADTRESLVAFSQSLQARSELSGVDVPASDFSKDKDIGFTLNFVMQMQ